MSKGDGIVFWPQKNNNERFSEIKTFSSQSHAWLYNKSKKQNVGQNNYNKNTSCL